MTKNKLFGYKDLADVKKAISKDPEIKYLRFMTADMHGERPCEFTVPVTELGAKLLEDGSILLDDHAGSGSFDKGFDASSLFPERINESDKNARFDFTTARVLPWSYHTKTAGYDRAWKEMVVFGDVVDPKNGPYKFDSRSILKRILETVKKDGLVDTVYLGPELEFFLFGANESGDPLTEEFKKDDTNYLRPVITDHGRYFKGGRHGEVRKEAQMAMMEMGFKLEYDHHEVSPGQHESDVHYMEAMKMADYVMLFRYVVKRVAQTHGLFASFMPKPIAGINGSGMHTHQSLFKGGKNIFFDSKDKNGMSLECKQYLAGLMKYLPEITAVLNPWVNSYKRLVPGYEAPTYICWDVQNRSSLIRIPGYDLKNPNGVRIELRNPDPACNPYLCFALQIAAGVKGIEEELKPPSGQDINVFHTSDEERTKRGIKRLPPDLGAALDLLEKSKLAKGVMGEEFLARYVEAKRAHVKAYTDSLGHRADDWSMKVQISRFEIETLLPIL